ncbi:MFS transporter [Streptomyces sp. 3MP-14]|uniref:MFS transporter n=1 Tax=Streptomyces mimosae TaxID=2586635 RepID=A0A5N6A5H8_9ACTN|nr:MULTISPECIES: MFS transporter [Streptomyces]KAB8162980.1 MFS transporter [Streptomyces mimosae]KAB8179195.1 MFS transporter [Streptomyces sp. 3MP-14]
MANSSGLRSYAEILRLPGAGRFVAASLVGRFPGATLHLAVVLLVTHVTGSYATAGAVSAAGALAYALLVPRVGRAVDRRGQRRVLTLVATVFALSGVLLVAAARAGAPTAVLLLAGAAFGATRPPLSALARARWSHLLRDEGSGRLLGAAYSWESVTEELLYVVGPLVVAGVVLWHPALGVLVVAALGLAGSLLMAGQRATEPPVAPRAPGDGGALANPGLRALCAVWVCSSAMFAAWELTTMAFVETHGDAWMIGPVLAAFAVGSAVGGLWYGTHAFAAPVDRRLRVALLLVVAGMAPLGAMPSVAVLGVFSLFSGLLVAPMTIAGYSLVREGVAASALTESMTWLSTATALGRAAGGLAAGPVLDAHGPRWGYALTLGLGLAALVVALPAAGAFRAMATARSRPARGGPEPEATGEEPGSTGVARP